MAQGNFNASGALLNSVPAAKPVTLTENYVDLRTSGWAQQYLPDLMEKEAEVFGNRTIGGFLDMVGAAEPMQSDQVIWSEQGRLHLSYLGNVVNETSPAGTKFYFHAVQDSDGNAVTGANALTNHGVRVGDMVIVAKSGEEVKAYVTEIDTQTQDGVVVARFHCTMVTAAGGDLTYTADSVRDTDVSARLLVFGSEYSKGTNGRAGSNIPAFKSFKNKPIIVKDKYEVSGSDASAIGWIEVSGEDGQAGYMWYLKAAGDTRQRFADYLEMTMLESELATVSITGAEMHQGGTVEGTEGLFAALKSRGNVFDGLDAADAASPANSNLTDFDAIISRFDEQGAIEEYMLFLDRATSLRIDDMLAGMNSYGSGGTSYGVFNNEEDMALNLGFSGFRRGSYDFYKTDWKYLNDKSTRGGINSIAGNAKAIRGVFVPAGVSSVYDQALGKNLKRPFLHVRYRASQMDDRFFKTWTTGSVGAATSDLDAMEMHFLSERCLVTQGANNFVLLQGAG
tara:strand:+ start:4130 stop:5656 length:1527 start_codon:yes stop_codon:yes gene_type:complete